MNPSEAYPPPCVNVRSFIHVTAAAVATYDSLSDSLVTYAPKKEYPDGYFVLSFSSYESGYPHRLVDASVTLMTPESFHKNYKMLTSILAVSRADPLICAFQGPSLDPQTKDSLQIQRNASPWGERVYPRKKEEVNKEEGQEKGDMRGGE